MSDPPAFGSFGFLFKNLPAALLLYPSSSNESYVLILSRFSASREDVNSLPFFSFLLCILDKSLSSNSSVIVISSSYLMLQSLPFDRNIVNGSTLCAPLKEFVASVLDSSMIFSFLYTSYKNYGIGSVRNLFALTSFIVVVESIVRSRQKVMNSKS